MFDTENQAASFARALCSKGTVVHADEAASSDNPHERLEIKKINHQKAHRLDGACPDMAEEGFSRLRRAGIDLDPHIAGACLLRHAGAPSFEKDAIVVTR